MKMKFTEVSRTTAATPATLFTDEKVKLKQSEIPSIDGASKRPNVKDEASGREVDTYTLPQAITTAPQKKVTPLARMRTKVTKAAPTIAATEPRDPVEAEMDLIRLKIPLIDFAMKIAEPKYRVKARRVYASLRRVVYNFNSKKLKAINSDLIIAKKSIDKANFILVESRLQKAKEYIQRGGAVRKLEKVRTIDPTTLFIFNEWEIQMMKSKMSRFRQFLKFADQKKFATLLQLEPNYLKNISNMDKKRLQEINLMIDDCVRKCLSVMYRIAKGPLKDGTLKIDVL
ncbi:hypothetical protein EGR_11328 [Echinococcus granulosus]|uniref:Uncharacterized protein n=1 Tax=Echinococcus granulosus TaxID=6210 RepID=W6TYM3_ECHGR|nr:hypothetical protein EGR_11328 [Echinococcus granulosus]EUB53823.1 hypothetical protein EGR_11328 [Echinococcus granulosus]